MGKVPLAFLLPPPIAIKNSRVKDFQLHSSDDGEWSEFKSARALTLNAKCSGFMMQMEWSGSIKLQLIFHFELNSL